MTRPLLLAATLGSLLMLPWTFTVFLALLAVIVEPLVPLAVGLLADALYYTPGVHAAPLYTILGLLVTPIAFLVHRSIKTSIIRE